MRRGALAILLVAVWVLLWDQVTLGQTIAGVAVAVALLVVLRPDEGGGQMRFVVRPVPIAKLVVWFARQVILSNLQVARAALWPRRYVRAGVVRVPLRTSSPQLAALVTNLTALSPGMQPIGSTDDPPSIEVHVLSLETDDHAVGIVTHLEELVVAAFGTDPEEAP